jgi:hypothetical protein
LRDELRGCDGKLLEQDGRQSEVAAGQDTPLRFAGYDFDLCEIVIRETRGSDHHMRAMFERRDDVGFGNLRLGVFHKNVAPIGERLGGGRVNWRC